MYLHIDFINIYNVNSPTFRIPKSSVMLSVSFELVTNTISAPAKSLKLDLKFLFLKKLIYSEF